MAAFWGTGRTASSDGQFFPAAGRGEALNLVNARYGAEPGVKAYSHVSDRFSIYWNTLKLGEAVFASRKAGLATPAEFLAHVSPLGWEHINLTGEYRWPRAGSTGHPKSLA